MQWPVAETWHRLSDRNLPWWEAENGSYLYKNVEDGRWWLDEPGGQGVYIAPSESKLPPIDGWMPLGEGRAPMPQLTVET